MGKVEDDQSLSSSTSTQISISNNNVDIRRCPRISFGCVIALVFGVAVLLSALFLLPPFMKRSDRADLDLKSLLKANHFVARFKLSRPVSVLKENIQQLQRDIFDEIEVPNSMVNVISLKPSAVPNATDVIFAVVHDMNSSIIPSASLSLLRENFVSLVSHQSYLHLTASLFGDPTSFEVLKFDGGITVIPPQSAYLLQKAQNLFNFTLNFSIDQIQENFKELRNQLKSGLHLAVNENLYIRLRNFPGSTADPPTTVQVYVLQAVGNLPPPLPRLKELAQTITGSPARNLGLNHTEFGKVKQVRLSSDLQHSLDSGGNSGTSGSPSPAPMPHPSDHHHHHHRHHHHHHQSHHRNQDFDQAPASAPAPAPSKNYQAKPPSGCRIGPNAKKHGYHHRAPAVAPIFPPRHSAASPHLHVDPPAPSPRHLPASPLPSLVFPHAHPPNKNAPTVGTPDITPNKNAPTVEPPDITPSISPMPSSSTTGLFPIQWLLVLLLPLLLTNLL